MKKRIEGWLVASILIFVAASTLSSVAMAEEGYPMPGPQMSDEPGSAAMKGPRDRNRGEGRGDEGMHESIPPGQWWRMPGIAESVGVTVEEQKTLDGIYMNHRREMISLKSQVEKEKLEFEYLLEKETIDEQSVKAQFDKLHNARGEMSRARFTFLLEVRKLLGYERYQKLKSEFQQRRMIRGDRGDRRPGGGGQDRGGPRQ